MSCELITVLSVLCSLCECDSYMPAVKDFIGVSVCRVQQRTRSLFLCYRSSVMFGSFCLCIIVCTVMLNE